jgi:drug/metabolite transporter (DMT)-like permease
MPKTVSARLQRWAAHRVHRHTAHLSSTTQGVLWAVAAGFLFSLLNALVRALSLGMDPFQAQFMRYASAVVVLLPIVIYKGIGNYIPRAIGGQFTRGALHTAGLCLWFVALPKIPLADMTAIGFTTPLFMMLGAMVFLKEPMHGPRWVATGVGFAGVLIVVGPQMFDGLGSAGLYHLIMLASAPLFAASFLVTKALTKYESTGTILVWQAITVSLFSLPLALWHWQAVTLWQTAGFLLSGLLGSAGHYAITRSFRATDISATQSVKFLDLIWAGILGWMIFGDVPASTALLGGVVIASATIWLARRERQAFKTSDSLDL